MNGDTIIIHYHETGTALQVVGKDGHDTTLPFTGRISLYEIADWSRQGYKIKSVHHDRCVVEPTRPHPKEFFDKRSINYVV